MSLELVDYCYKLVEENKYFLDLNKYNIDHSFLWIT